ncbi:radical SAM protein [Roseateles sp. MS654]|uniref:radical SAM protein n=1 Tax=Roseateles sp. MS654 TaxID=3412685 RepID=UPI003C2E3C79
MAMPLAYPFHPSSQIGYLHGYVEAMFPERLEVHSHHAFLKILNDLEGADLGTFFEEYSLVGEEVLFLATCYSAFKHGEYDLPPARGFSDVFARYDRPWQDTPNESQQTLVPISPSKVMELADATERYIEATLLPALRGDRINVIGFTASFCQVFGSILAARHIARLTDKPVVFLFGGSSFSLPEGLRALKAWGLDGYVVMGSGEAPLHEFLQVCLDADSPHGIHDVIEAANLTNVCRVGRQMKPIDLRMGKRYMDTLPDPNYQSYFSDLRALCAGDNDYRFLLTRFVSLPVEGSRGCFAKCDFCHNPNITSEFRSLSGQAVAERVNRLTQRYGVPDITFVDSVSNTWAEDYADSLLDRGETIKAFMELRVHAPETFWTKLALSGATTLQLGIEAISDPLLSSMRKATTVAQNIAATKYMTELGTRDASNLIIQHPKSTLYDVQETIRVMRLLEHMPIFHLSRFVVSHASPIYNELTEEKKQQLKTGFDWLPRSLEEYGWPRHLSYTWPSEWIDPDVHQAWLDFQGWYREHVQEIAAREIEPTLTVSAVDGELRIVDTRHSRRREILLTGDEAQLYELCHKPHRKDQIIKVIGWCEERITPILERFVREGIVLDAGEYFLSIALRSRQTLLDNLARAEAASAKTRTIIPISAPVPLRQKQVRIDRPYTTSLPDR